MYFLIRFLPKKFTSFLVGRLFEVKLPAFLALLVNKIFIHCFGVNVAEIEKPLEDYRSLGEFFTRRLKPGNRPISEGIISPVDGEIVVSGKISTDTLFNAKNQNYSLSSLIGDRIDAEFFSQGSFITFYLSPRDYHHIHAPESGEIFKVRHVRGTLWPVNRYFSQRMPELFTLNERIITFIKTNNHGTIAVIKVGALNVGSISLNYIPYRSNLFSMAFTDLPVQSADLQLASTLLSMRRKVVIDSKEHFISDAELETPIQIKKGEMLASFNLGSTVIVLFETGRIDPQMLKASGKILYGSSINRG